MKFAAALRNDVDIIDGNLFLAWAYGAADGAGPTSYAQHTVRGTASVNFLAGDVANGYGFITDAGLGLTATIVVILGFFALIHLAHWSYNLCAERKRRNVSLGDDSWKIFFSSSNSFIANTASHIVLCPLAQ